MNYGIWKDPYEAVRMNNKIIKVPIIRDVFRHDQQERQKARKEAWYAENIQPEIDAFYAMLNEKYTKIVIVGKVTYAQTIILTLCYYYFIFFKGFIFIEHCNIIVSCLRKWNK